MKTKTLSFLFFITCSFFGVATAQEQELLAQSVITVSEYGAFLNANATADDIGHFYNEKMASTPAVLLRLGEPGSYHYEVRNGNENTAVDFISDSNALAYASWKKCSLAPCNIDRELCSNIGAFLINDNRSLRESTSQSNEEAWLPYFLGETLFAIGATATGYYCYRSRENNAVNEGTGIQRADEYEEGNGSEDCFSGEIARHHLLTLPTLRATEESSISYLSFSELLEELNESPPTPGSKSDVILIPKRLFNDHEEEDIKKFMSELLSSHQTHIAKLTKKPDALYKEVEEIRKQLAAKNKDYQDARDQFEKIIEELLVGAKVTSHYTVAVTGKQSSYAELASKTVGGVISNFSNGLGLGIKKAISAHVPIPGLSDAIVGAAQNVADGVMSAGEKYLADAVNPSEDHIIEEVLSQITIFLEQQGFEDKKNVAERVGDLKGAMSNFLSQYNTSLKKRLGEAYVKFKKTYTESEENKETHENKEKKGDAQEEKLRDALGKTSFFKESIQQAKNNWGECRDAFRIIKSKWGGHVSELENEVSQKNKKAQKALALYRKNDQELTVAKQELENLNQGSIDDPEVEAKKREARLKARKQERTTQFLWCEYQKIQREFVRASILFETYKKVWENGWLRAWPNERDVTYPTPAGTSFGSLTTDPSDQLNGHQVKKSSWDEVASSRQEELFSRPQSASHVKTYKMLFEDFYKTGGFQPEHIALTMDYLQEALNAQEKKISHFKNQNRDKLKQKDAESLAALNDYRSDAAWLRAEQAEVTLLLKNQSRSQLMSSEEEGAVSSSSNEAINDLVDFSLVQRTEKLWNEAAKRKQETVQSIEELPADAALRGELPIINIERLWAEAECHRLHVGSSPNNLVYFLPLEDHRNIFNFKKEFIPSLEEKKKCILETQQAWKDFIKFYNDNKSTIDQLSPIEKAAWEGRFERAERYHKLDELRIGYLEYRLAFENLNSSSGGRHLQLAWEKLMTIYEATQDALPENRRELVKASLKILSFLLEAKKKETDATCAEQIALTLKAENKGLFESAWNQAINRVQDVASAYQKLAKMQCELTVGLTEQQKKIWDQSLSEAQYNSVLYRIREHVLAAEKSIKIAKLAHDKAVSLNPKDSKFDLLSLDIRAPGQDRHAVPSFSTPGPSALSITVRENSPNSPDEDFNKLWDAALATSLDVREKFENVAALYHSSRSNVPADYRPKWDMDFRAAQCGVVHYELDFAWLQAIKAGDKVTDVKRDQAFGFDARASADRHSQDICQEAVSAAEEAVEKCNNLLTIYRLSQEKFKKILSKDGILFSQFEEYPQLEEINNWLNEEKENHAIVSAYNNAIWLDYNDAGFESAWEAVGEAATKAQESTQAILSYFEKLDATKQNPNDMIKYRYWISFYETMPHLIAAELADKQAVATSKKVEDMTSRFNGNACFGFVQKEARQQALDAGNAWKKYAAILAECQTTQIPESRKLAWGDHIKRANDQVGYWEKQVEDSQKDQSVTRQLTKIKSGDVDYWKQRIESHNNLVADDYLKGNLERVPIKMELTREDLFRLSKVLEKNGSNADPVVFKADEKAVEAAFEEARNTKIVIRNTERNTAWDQAATAAQVIVKGCDGKLRDVLTDSTEIEKVAALPKEIINKKEYWLQKKLIADARQLASISPGSKPKHKQNKSNEIIKFVRENIWNLISEDIKILEKRYDPALIQPIKDLLFTDSLAAVAAFDAITGVAAMPISLASLSVESDRAYVSTASYIYSHAYIAAMSAKAVIMEEADFVVQNALNGLKNIVTTQSSKLNQKDEVTLANIEWAQESADQISKFIKLVLGYQKNNLGDQVSEEYNAAAAAYARAEQERNASNWKEASTKVKAIANDWSAIFQEIENTRSLEKFLKRVKCQQINWFQKTQIADFMSAIETPHAGSEEKIEDACSDRMISGIKEKVWRPMEEVFNEFIDASHPTKTQMIDARKTAFIFASIIPSLYASVFSDDCPSAPAYAYASACAYLYAYATGSAPHMIDVKEALYATRQSADAAIHIAKSWRHSDQVNEAGVHNEIMKNDHTTWLIDVSKKAIELAEAFVKYKEQAGEAIVGK